jgi:hypothetical protein
MRSPLALTSLFLVTCASPAFAQSVVVPLQSDQQYQSQPAQPSTQLLANAKPAPDVPTFWLWGPVTAHPRVSYQFVTSTGVQYAPGFAADTTIQTLSPGILMELGTHWTLDYQASWDVYSSRQFKDTLNHTLSLLGSTAYENWTFSFSQGYSRTSEPLIQTGQQTQSNGYSTVVIARDRIDRHLMLESVASQSLVYTTGFNNTREWSLLEWVHYQFTPQLDTALGIGPGYVNVHTGADSNYYRFLGQIDWRLGTKLTLHLDGGLDHRRLHMATASYTNSPVANASIGYQMFEHTSLTIGASRTVTPSYFANRTQKGLSWNAGINQRLLGHFNLNLSAGYQKSSYDQTDPTSTTTPARNDNNHWYDARLSTAVLKRGTISVFYHRSQNSSNLLGYSFSSDQYGLELRYQY